MSSLPDGRTDALSNLQRGLEAYFTLDALEQLFEAIDVDALLSDSEFENAVEYERMGELVGQLAGRLIVRQTVGRVTPGQFAEQMIGYTVGGMIGKKGMSLLLEHHPERLFRSAREEIERGAGPSDSDATVIEIEDVDAGDDEGSTFELSDTDEESDTAEETSEETTGEPTDDETTDDADEGDADEGDDTSDADEEIDDPGDFGQDETDPE